MFFSLCQRIQICCIQALHLLDSQEAWPKNKNYYSILCGKKIEKASQVKVEVTGALNMPIRSLTAMNIT